MSQAQKLARHLFDARSAARSIAALTDDNPDLTVDDAYKIQDEFVALLTASPNSVGAIKLGLTSRVKQEQMNVDEPLYGVMSSDMRITDGVVHLERYGQPRGEPEIAFEIGSELAGDVTADDVLMATTAVMPAIDILDSRFSGYSFKLADVIADNASAAGYAIGERVSPSGIDLDLVGCVFSVNGDVAGAATGAAVLGHPAASVAWLVRKLAESGRSVPAGSVILSGALTAAVPLHAEDSLLVEIDRIGAIELRVV